ncbi:hypothetical protein ACMYYO_01930 [Dermacoccaceae bacterium W4C1]
MTVTNVAIALLVLAVLLRRQLQVRPVRADSKWLGLAIITVLGVAQVQTFAGAHTVPPRAWALTALGLLSGSIFGVARAHLTRLWTSPEGELLRQGNAATVVLWVVGIAVHIGTDLVVDRLDPSAAGVGMAALTLYLAASIAVQRLWTQRRARALTAGRSASVRSRSSAAI